MDNWIDLALHADTGIESVRAHFKGHAYEPHWHDSFVIGFTEQGVQQFHCRRLRHHSTPGQVFLLEPGELHDGHAPTEDGFTYSTLYLRPDWLESALCALFEQAPAHCLPGFADTLSEDPILARSIARAFQAVHGGSLRMAQDVALDDLLAHLTRHVHWRRPMNPDPRLPGVARRAQELIHACYAQDLSLDSLAEACQVDRFRLTRAFRSAFGLPPHAYLVQVRLAKARELLARGDTPVRVAGAVGFADQSHLGRWFQRAYRLTPADYRRRCSNLPDR